MRYWISLYLIFCAHLCLASNLLLQEDAPRRYVVKPGDSLWSISSRYLKHPWEWKRLMYANPNIQNPKRLYVGAVLELNTDQSPPYLKVLSNGVVKWSPHTRISRSESLVPPIPLHNILPFLNGSMVLDDKDLLQAPYVLAYTDEHMLGGQGDEVYVENLHVPVLPEGRGRSYAIFRPAKAYVEPFTGRLLGYSAELVGNCDLLRIGNPASVMITDIVHGVRIKDRLVSNKGRDFNLYFYPQVPLYPVEGSIIDLLGDFTQGAVGFVAVLDRGEDAGLKPGDVLGIYSKKRKVLDPMHRNLIHYPPLLTNSWPSVFPPDNTITLPSERIGELMVFRVFTQTSFALIVRSVRAVHILDHVSPP